MSTKTVLTTPNVAGVGEQLSLLVPADVPAQFRLDVRTRRSGLEHVAALRSQMAAQAAARPVSPGRKRPSDLPRQVAA